MQPASQDPALDFDRPAHPWARRAVGAAILSCGVTLLVFLVWFSYRVAIVGKAFELGVLTFMGVTVSITAFCLFMGYRLSLDRPNQHGSLLSPLGWKVLGGVFALFAIGTAVLFLWVAQYAGLVGSACAAVFASWCVRAAKAARERKSNDPSAL